jgi:hypothetical protein
VDGHQSTNETELALSLLLEKRVIRMEANCFAKTPSSGIDKLKMIEILLLDNDTNGEKLIAKQEQRNNTAATHGCPKCP